MVGTNKTVEQTLRYMTPDDRENLEYFCASKLSEDYQILDNESKRQALLEEATLTQDEKETLLNYSGFNYKHINAALRNNWNYELNGNSANQEEYRKIGFSIVELIRQKKTGLKENIITYRGVDLSYFKDYGITSLDELQSLEGNFLLDSGLVSTSLEEKTSYFKKENDLGLNYNIKIEYMVPQEFKDGIYLTGNASYNPEQQEFLINASNLSKVNSVTINPDNTAVIKTTLIPKEIYDSYYRENKKQK